MARIRVQAVRFRIPALTLSLILLATCSEDRQPVGPGSWRSPTGLVSANAPVVLVGAGDIADCTDIHDEETAGLLDGIDGTVFTAGDNAYENGSDADFQNCYAPSWGRHKARTHPVTGNHEYNTAGAAGYFNYFGTAAGEPGKGYYSYDLGDWHIVALNNYIAMNPGSEQDNWLRADLDATTQPCKLAVYHEPLYSSTTGVGSGGVTTSSIRPLFNTLYEKGVDVVLNGHRHFYERMAPMNPDGQPDNTAGIREFIVGTGGASMGAPTNAFPLSEVRFGSGNYGVLKLYLYPDSYAWRFVPIPGRTLTDTGSYACHGFGSGVSASQSTVTASPPVINNVDGVATITVTVKDGFGNPVSGASVQLTATGTSNVLTQPGPTGSDGVATGTLSSTQPELKTVSATANGVVINQTATVMVTTPSVITRTLLTAGNNVVNQKIYTTASIAPAANTLITVAVLGHSSAVAPPSPTLSGGGMTAWTEVASTTFDPVGAPRKRLTIFRAMSSAPGSGPLTITFGTTVSNAQWIVSQWGGVDLTGVNGAGAIVQSGSTRADAVSGLAVVLAAFGNGNNASYGVFGVARSTVGVTPGAGFTELSEQASGESAAADLEAEAATNHSTIDASWPTSANAGALGVEIKAAASGSGAGVDAAQSSVSAAPTSITAGGAGSTITVTVRDASGDPISGATVELAASPAAGSTVTQPITLTDGNGMVTGTVSSTVAEVKTVSATANGTALTEHAFVTVTPGAVSATHSSLTASPTSIAPGGQTATITVAVKDAHDNPISDAAVLLNATPTSGISLTQPSATDAGGMASGALSSTTLGQKTVTADVTVGGVTTTIAQAAFVTVTNQGAAAITHALLTAGNNVVNQKIYTTASIAPAANTLITVAVLGHSSAVAPPSPTLSGGGMTAWTEVASTTFDPVGAPRKRLTIFRAMSSAPGSGPLTITFAATVSNAQWIVSQWDGVDQSGVNGAGAIVQSGSTRADAVSGLAVTLAGFSNSGNASYGVFGVMRSTLGITPGTGFTELSEQASGESAAADLQAETAPNHNPIDATWPTNVNAGALGVEIRAAASGGGGGVDAAQSTLEASPTSITPGGAGSTIEVTVRDANGGPISGATVELTAIPATGTTITQPVGVTDVDGVATGIVTSTKAELKTITATATLGSVTTAITQHAVVNVTPGPVSAARSTVTASPTQIASGGETATITVTVLDANDNPISGATVALSALPASGTSLSAPGATNATGVYTGSFSSAQTGGHVVSATATVGTEQTAITQTATVTVTGGSGVSATLSTVVAAPTSIAAGSGSSTITVTVKDGANQPISGATVQLAATPITGNTLVQPSAVTGANGQATGTLSSTKAELKTVSATATLGSVTTAITATAAVTVGPGPVSATHSTLSANPTSITQGSGSSTITVTVLDANDNPIGGATVALAATPAAGATFSAPGATNASGVYTGTFSSTVTGDKTISASATVGSVTTGVSQTATVTVTSPVAITQTLLTAGSNAVNQKIYTTAVIAPSPNTLVTVAVLELNSSAAPPLPTLTGGGMAAWTVVASTTFDTGTLPLRRVTIFRALSATPGSDAITITSSVTLSNCEWIVSQWGGVDLSGVNGAGAIGQTGATTGEAVSGLTVPLAAFGNANNVGYGVFGVRSNVAVVAPGGGFTEIAEQPPGESTPGDLEAEWAPNLNTITAAWAPLNAAALGIEIKAGTAVP